MKLNDSTSGAEAVTSASKFPMSREWLESHWMAFTGNRDFKANPRMMVGAQGAYFTDSNGKKILTASPACGARAWATAAAKSPKR